MGYAPKPNKPNNYKLLQKVKPDIYFKRDGFDITTEALVTVSEAVLGHKFSVKTLDGEKDIRIAMGTPDGFKIRIPGQVGIGIMGGVM